MGQKVLSRRIRFGSVLIACVVLLGAMFLAGGAATASALTGGVSPTVFGNLADLNGDGVVNGADDSSAFYGDTSIINGALDCEAWGATPNAGTVGDGVIDASDDCTLIGYDGTADGVTIGVVDGQFATADGSAIPDGWPLPKVFNAGAPNDPSIIDSDFAWSTIAGKVDANGDGTIDGDDCSVGVVGVENVLGQTCGFSPTPPPSSNGLVDVNGDALITASDTCVSGCFLGHNVTLGVVQAEGPGIGPAGPAGPAGVSGRTTVSHTSPSNSRAKSVSAICPAGKKVLGGGFTLHGRVGVVGSLLVRASFPRTARAWTVRVFEGSSTSGAWSVTAKAVCAIA
jgi:hypothetical protein